LFVAVDPKGDAGAIDTGFVAGAMAIVAALHARIINTGAEGARTIAVDLTFDAASTWRTCREKSE